MENLLTFPVSKMLTFQRYNKKIKITKFHHENYNLKKIYLGIYQYTFFFCIVQLHGKFAYFPCPQNARICSPNEILSPLPPRKNNTQQTHNRPRDKPVTGAPLRTPHTEKTMLSIPFKLNGILSW